MQTADSQTVLPTRPRDPQHGEEQTAGGRPQRGTCNCNCMADAAGHLRVSLRRSCDTYRSDAVYSAYGATPVASQLEPCCRWSGHRDVAWPHGFESMRFASAGHGTGPLPSLQKLPPRPAAARQRAYLIRLFSDQLF
jgi:hypothetical protein